MEKPGSIGKIWIFALLSLLLLTPCGYAIWIFFVRKPSDSPGKSPGGSTSPPGLPKGSPERPTPAPGPPRGMLGGQPPTDDTEFIQSLIDSTPDSKTLTLGVKANGDRIYYVSDTIYISKSMTIQGDPKLVPRISSVRDTAKFKDQLVTVKMNSNKNVPVFLVAKKSILDEICKNSDVNLLYQGGPDYTVEIKNLCIVGNNNCSVSPSGSEKLSCDHVIDSPASDWSNNQDLAKRYKAFATADLTFPRSKTCMAQSYFSTVSDDKCSAEISQQKLTEVDANHDVWSYMCAYVEDNECNVNQDCDLQYSYLLDGYKSSAVQIVHCTCKFDFCYIERGLSAGIGASYHSVVEVSNSCLANNRWDGFGPDLLSGGFMYFVYTFGNGGVGVSLSKGDNTVPNEPVCFNACEFEDGVYMNYYTDMTFCQCVITGNVSLGDNEQHDITTNATAVLFQNCSSTNASFSPGTRKIEQNISSCSVYFGKNPMQNFHNSCTPDPTCNCTS